MTAEQFGSVSDSQKPTDTASDANQHEQPEPDLIMDGDLLSAKRGEP